MKEIELTQGYKALVDDEDYEVVNSVRWYLKRNGSGKPYAATGGEIRDYMHRFLTNPPDGFEVDHINSNGLDNRRENLRVITHSRNMMNSILRSNNTSGYIGVVRFRNKWRAQVIFNNKTYYAGLFDNPEDAAKARDKKCIELDGECYKLNFPQVTAETTEN